ncbi:MAG: hypothetical protein E3J56_14760 [Candidatus Aminicenantes bacterium]|nr:MAG: hypothetical protein E3J56_14760 [Candidatus Aminicenantes bacterium]
MEAGTTKLMEEAKYLAHTPGMLGESSIEKLKERILSESGIVREVCLDVLMEIMQAKPSKYNLGKKKI